MKYHQLTSQQRSQIFALLQNKTKRKIIASIVGCSQSTLSREINRNSTEKGNYLWDKAHAKAMERRKRTTSNSAKDPSTLTDEFIRRIQYKINRRPRKKLNFESPKTVFFRKMANSPRYKMKKTGLRLKAR